MSSPTQLPVEPQELSQVSFPASAQNPRNPLNKSLMIDPVHPLYIAVFFDAFDEVRLYIRDGDKILSGLSHSSLSLPYLYEF